MKRNKFLSTVLAATMAVSMFSGLSSVSADEIKFPQDVGSAVPYNNLDYAACAIDNGKIYMVFNETSNVNSAYQFAKRIGGELVVIRNEAENEFILDLINSVKKDKCASYYIGITDQFKEGEWTDFEGNPVPGIETFFDNGEPNNSGPKSEQENFVAIFSDAASATNNGGVEKCHPGRWNDNVGKSEDGYGKKVGFIVQVPLEEVKFGRNYEYNGHTYFVCDNEISWVVAKAVCEQNNFYPASINTSEENEFLQKMLSQCDRENYIIGGSKNGNNIKWEDKTTGTYTNWGDTKADKDEKSIAINVNDGKWSMVNSTACTDGYGYVFELNQSVKADCKHEHMVDGVCEDCGYIAKIDIEDVKKPEPGEKFDTEVKIDGPAKDLIESEVTWYELNDKGNVVRKIGEDETAVEGTTYQYETSFSFNSDVVPFWWDGNTKVVFEGEEHEFIADGNSNKFSSKINFKCETKGNGNSNFRDPITPTPTTASTPTVTPTVTPSATPNVTPTATPSSTKAPTSAPTPTPMPHVLDVGDFVSRCYTVALDREPDSQGYEYWCDSLNNGQACGAQVGYGFIFSQEYINKNKSNEDYVTDLYKMYFDREGDNEGYAYWVDLLNNGATREDVFAGFANSQEFYNLCISYGVVSGVYLVKVPNDQQGGVNCFVARLYRVCLDRLPDQGGHAGWVMKLMNCEVTGSSCAYGFVFSPEFINMNLSDEDYIKHMYRAFFGREGEEEGVNYWVDRLANGTSKNDIFAGFSGSTEFQNLCAGYGINA